MPGQTFSDPISGQRVVTLTWDIAERALDVDAGGTLLTRVTDIATLSTSGMEGYTASGEHLRVRRQPGASGFDFYVQRNGETLTASFVNFGMAGPSLEGPAMAMDHQKVAPRADGLAFDEQGRLRQHGKIVDQSSLTKSPGQQKDAVQAIDHGRKWVLGLIGLNALFSLFGTALFATVLKAEAFPVAVMGIIFLIVFAIYSIPLVLSYFLVKGPQPKKSGFLLAQIFLWLTYVGSPLLGWFIIYKAHKALGGARQACS